MINVNTFPSLPLILSPPHFEKIVTIPLSFERVITRTRKSREQLVEINFNYFVMRNDEIIFYIEKKESKLKEKLRKFRLIRSSCTI